METSPLTLCTFYTKCLTKHDFCIAWQIKKLIKQYPYKYKIMVMQTKQNHVLWLFRMSHEVWDVRMDLCVWSVWDAVVDKVFAPLHLHEILEFQAGSSPETHMWWVKVDFSYHQEWKSNEKLGKSGVHACAVQSACGIYNITWGFILGKTL